MQLKMPTSEQAAWGLRAMKTVALADGALHEAELRMLALADHERTGGRS